ncbi:MAG: Gmad2 immunoglobulin-like domain-containing protein [Patescibacteria group bacterium]
MKKQLKPTPSNIALSICLLLIIGFGIYLVFNYLNKSALNQPNTIINDQNNIVNTASTSTPIITYLVSKEDPIKYCNGADMDSVGYQKTITVKESTSTLEINPTKVQIIKAVINAATTGMCRSVLNQLDITEDKGTVSIPPIDAWAGVSITMCSCKPQVETNLLQIPGITKVIWSTIAKNPVNESSKTNLIRVDYPLPNQVITSPLIIKGQARGSWFFEASFPVVLVDWDGKIIAQGIAQAKSNWMTNEFVPFEATISYVADQNVYSTKGALILRKDNPSGLPANDNALEIPVIINGDTAPMKACTQEAKLCADGSYVGRTGPNCEFTPCP